MSTQKPTDPQMDAAVAAALQGHVNTPAKMAIVVTIGLDPRTGQVAMESNLADHVVLLGMLAQATRLVYKQQDAAEAKARGGGRLVLPA